MLRTFFSTSESEKSVKIATNSCINIFSNDGSFLDQFKQLNKEGTSTSSCNNNKMKSKTEKNDNENYSHFDKHDEKKNRYIHIRMLLYVTLNF